MKIVILGLSRFGVQFARLMHEAEHQITLIDRNPSAFGRVPRGITAQHVLGIGIDQDVMRKAGVDKADVFVAATASDNTNLMAAQVAKVVFNIKRSIARVHDHDRADIFNSLGLIEVICPPLAAAETLGKTIKQGA